MVAGAIRQAFLQTDAEAAHQTWRPVADQLRPRWPKLAALTDDSEHDVLAYMGFPGPDEAQPPYPHRSG
jgi:putative transposase